MRCLVPGAFRIGFTLILLLCGLGLSFSGRDAKAAGSTVQHLTEHTIVASGETRMISFRCEPAADEAMVLLTEVADPRILSVLGAAKVLSGQELGYVRVRGLEPGETVLHIQGQPLRIQVIKTTGSRDRSLAPRIIGPAPAAAVFGTVSIGVEVRQEEGRPLPDVFLALSTGETLSPEKDSKNKYPPYRQLLYRLDLNSKEEGPLTLTPVSIHADSSRHEGKPVIVRVIAPSPADIQKGEAEADYKLDRPRRFQDSRMVVGNSPKASQGRYFANASSNPTFCFPIHVEKEAYYQVFLTAGGTRAQGVLPTVEIVVDGAAYSRTNVRILDEAWHRIAVGIPIRLDPGDHIVSPLFSNDFYVPGLADRNLWLDHIEVVRLDEFSPATGPSDSEMASPPSMMKMTTMAPRTMKMGMSPTSTAGKEAFDPLGLTPVAVRVAFVRPLDQFTIPGLTEIEGRCWWYQADSTRTPSVDLIINGKPVSTQRSAAPKFWVDPHFFVPGRNEVELVATTDSGSIDRTPKQTLYYPKEAAKDRLSPRTHHRFSIHEKSWDPAIEELLKKQHYPNERRAALFSSNQDLSLHLPQELEGTFDIFLEARGDAFEGLPIAQVSLVTNGEKKELGEAKLPNWWDTKRTAENVRIKAGIKKLVVSFTNDHYAKDAGDRNLWLQSVVLVERPQRPDRIPPTVSLLYPRENQEVFAQDTVVATASDNASLASAELLLDGMQTQLTVGLNRKPGPIVFPLILRRLSPGEHTVTVLVRDIAGNVTVSEARTIYVLEDPPKNPSIYERAVHLLNRLAYGPDPVEMASLLTQGEDLWLEDRLDRPFDSPGDLAALGTGYTYFAGRSNYESPRRVLSHLLLTPNPTRARFVLWAQNHFSTWIQKTQGERKWAEHIAFSKLGVSSFPELLATSAESPAMLGYLDQDTSYSGRMNENYSREILELHTLGVKGGYTQQDVTHLAHLMTGWTASLQGDGLSGGQALRTYSFRFDPQLNDGRAREILGFQFNDASQNERYDRARTALELLSCHPSTASFVSTKLIEHYITYPAPLDLVSELSQVFIETHGDMKALLTTMVKSPHFWANQESGRFAHPLDFIVRFGRTTGHFQPWQAGEFLQRSGTGLFDRSTPDGYPQEDEAYLDSNAMLQRWKFGQQTARVLAGAIPHGWRQPGFLPDHDWADLIIDMMAVRLTGRILSPASHDAALEFIQSVDGSRTDRLLATASLLYKLPEANKR